MTQSPTSGSGNLSVSHFLIYLLARANVLGRFGVPLLASSASSASSASNGLGVALPARGRPPLRSRHRGHAAWRRGMRQTVFAAVGLTLLAPFPAAAVAFGTPVDVDATPVDAATTEGGTTVV